MTPSVTSILRVVRDGSAADVAQGHLAALSHWVFGFRSVPQFRLMVRIPNMRTGEWVERGCDRAEVIFHSRNSTRVQQ